MRSVGTGEFLRFATSQLGIGVLLAATGLITWSSVSFWSGLAPEAESHFREAWSNAVYFYAGAPIMALAVAAAAFLHPERPWRWPLWLVAGHQLGAMLTGIGMQSGLSLVLVAVILGVLLAVAFAVPAALGAMAARALEERAY